MSSQVEGFVKGMLLGGMIGAAIALLYAPQSGRKTRKDIERNAERLLDDAKEEYEAALKKSGRAYQSAVKKLRRLESSVKERVGEVGETVEALSEQGEEALQETKDRLRKAVDGAVHAFK